jgi:hypothetical protein
VKDVDYSYGYPPFSSQLTTLNGNVNLLYNNKIWGIIGDIHAIHSPYYYYVFSFLICILIVEGTERPEGAFQSKLTRSGEADES